MPGPWSRVVRLAHIELTNADNTFSAWLTGILSLIGGWSLSERKRALALATSQKVGSSSAHEPVLAVKYTEPRFRCVGGVPMGSLARIAGELGGVSDHPCSKFLSPAIELEDSETEINAMNRKSARAILFPLKVCLINFYHVYYQKYCSLFATLSRFSLFVPCWLNQSSCSWQMLIPQVAILTLKMSSHPVQLIWIYLLFLLGMCLKYLWRIRDLKMEMSARH